MGVFRAPRSTWLILGVAVAVFAACGGSDGIATIPAAGDDDDGGVLPVGDAGQLGPLDGSGGEAGHPHAKALVFDPPAQTVTVDGVAPTSAQYALKATLDDGSVVAVTA